MINIEELREYCLSKNGVEESFPFDNKTLVFKICNKMFLLTDIEEAPVSFNVKCEPARAIELREEFSCVIPGYHMNKKHWNTIIIDNSVSAKQLFEWIDDSYRLVVAGLTKAQKKQLDNSL